MIVYGIATETSIGRLFLAGVVPGLMLTSLFMVWALVATWRSGASDAATAAPITMNIGIASRVKSSR